MVNDNKDISKKLNVALLNDNNETYKLYLNFINHLKYEKQCSKNTISGYGRDILYFFYFVINEYKIENISLIDLLGFKANIFRSWLMSKSLSGVTKRSLARNLSAVKSFYRWLEINDYGKNQYLLTMRIPKFTKNLPRAIEVSDIKDFLEASLDYSNNKKGEKKWVSSRNYAVLLLLYGCGLRISEALNLNYSDFIDANDSLIIMGKGNKQRMIPLSNKVKKAIKKYVIYCPYEFINDKQLFFGVRGGRLSARIIQIMVADLRRTLGLSNMITPHAIRHSFATHLLNEDVDLRVIQELLGHSSLSSTQIYTNMGNKKLLMDYKKFHPRK